MLEMYHQIGIKKGVQPTTEVFQNDSIKNLSECIYKIASDDGSHLSPSKYGSPE